MSKGVRVVLNSHFDHVALLLKFEASPNNPYILEAVGNGVQLQTWSSLR